MALVQVRDVPDETVARLKAQAKAKGLTMAAYIRGELEKLAERPTNREVLEQVRRHREQHPVDITTDEIVAIIRKTRDAS
jgi:predicted DNA-binding protein